MMGTVNKKKHDGHCETNFTLDRYFRRQRSISAPSHEKTLLRISQGGGGAARIHVAWWARSHGGALEQAAA